MSEFAFLGNILSPPSAASRSSRMAGRFGLQMVGDTISFAHNLPHRLLLLDRLERLPEIFDRLLDNKDLRELIRTSALRAANVDEIADQAHRAQVEAVIREDLRRIWAMSSASRRSLVEHSADFLCFTAAEAWACAHTNHLTDALEAIKKKYAEGAFPPRWFFVMQEALPHLEREIWLTETSAPLPAHALVRMHDSWALFILLWCYQLRRIFHDTPRAATDEVVLHDAFFTTVLKVAVIGGWTASTEEKDAAAGEHQVKLVVGPIFVLNEGTSQEPDQIRPHLHCARQFLLYMRFSSTVVPEWSPWAGTIASLEELMDAHDSRFPVAAPIDLRVRCNGIRQAWLRVNCVRLARTTPHLSRDDWEFCAALCAWVARWERLLAPKILTTGPQLLGMPRWNGVALQVSAESEASVTATLVSTDVEPTIAWLEELKQGFPELDLPLVLWNRLRERQNAAWSASISAMSNLMQRRSTRPGRFRKAGESEREASHLLLGFGDRICRHIVDIGQSDEASVYWLDYETNPPRLKLVASHSRAIKARSHRLAVHAEFDAIAYQPDDPTASCNARHNAVSLAYRCAASNSAEIWSDDTAKSANVGALLAGYTELRIPRSAMAVPLRANGRVIGVLELAASSSGQFGKQLRAPLRRVASLIGPVLYQNLLLWQLGRINLWTASLSPHSMESHRSNRLSNLASLLSNVFACPLVHIWLRGADHRLFELEGSSRSGVFDSRGSREDSPYFMIDDSAFETVGSTVPFEVAALALWNVPRPPRGRTGDAPARRAPAWGHLVKAIYRPELQSSHGDLESALGVGIQLGQDFLDISGTHTRIRRWIVEDQGLSEMAAFAIVREASPNPALERQPPEGSLEVVGIVSLHDYGDATDPSTIADESPPVIKQGTFGVAWIPIVAFMQEHLANVLPQVRLLNDRVEQVRQILLHEARHEVRTAADHFKRLFIKIESTLENSASAIERIRHTATRDEGAWRVDDEAIRSLSDVERALRAIVVDRGYFDVEATAFGLMRLYARLAAVKDFHDLHLPATEQIAVVELGAGMRQELITFVMENRARRRQVHLSENFLQGGEKATSNGGGRTATREWTRRGPEVLLVQSIWQRVLQNLLENMSKYSADGSTWNISLDVPTRQLQFSNIGPYDQNRDNPKELLQSARRGVLVRHLPGDGLGLSIAHRAAAALAIQLTYEIENMGEGMGKHKIVLDLQNVWRHSGEQRPQDEI